MPEGPLREGGRKTTVIFALVVAVGAVLIALAIYAHDIVAPLGTAALVAAGALLVVIGLWRM